LLVWGSPCQDLSLAGKRKGFNGEKSYLFREGARIQSEIMPKAFIFENVKGLLSSNGREDYKEVIKTFRDMGYSIAMKVMNTKNYGVPQNRERVFIVGFLDVNDYRSFSFEDGFKLNEKLEDYIDMKIKRPILPENIINSFCSGKSVFSERFSIKDLKKDFIANCLDTRSPRSRRTSTFFLTNNGVSYATPRESFRLQGVKDEDIDLVVSDSQAYKIAGNAISVNVMQSLLRSLYKPVHKKDTLF
jgi:DNA (cytosine-5)-methyltransferase 1